MPKVIFILPDASERDIDIEDGLTLMEGARDSGVPGVVAECGGGCICGTCHVQVDPGWFAQVGRAEGTEAALLEMVPEGCETSRLACQILVTAALEGLRVRVPSEQISSAI